MKKLLNYSYLILLILAPCSGNATQPKKTKHLYRSASITVHFPDASKNDTLTLQVFKETLTPTFNKYLPQNLKTSAKDSKGDFVFHIDSLDETCYITLTKGKDENFWPLPVLDLYLVEPNDNISIDVKKDSLYTKKINKVQLENGFDPNYRGIYLLKYYSFYFSGNGSAKYQCRYNADRVSSADLGSAQVFSNGKFNANTHYDSAKTKSIHILENFRSKITKTAYDLLKMDFIGRYDAQWFTQFSLDYSYSFNQDPDTLKWLTALERYSSKPLSLPSTVTSNSAMATSAYFTLGYLSKQVSHARVLSHTKDSTVYNVLKKSPTGPLRDKMITSYILDWFNYLHSPDAILTDALSAVSTTYCHDQLIKLQNRQMIGKLGFNFKLPDTSGNTIAFDSFKGKVVFLDFWYNKCGHCIDYYKNVLSKIEEKYKDTPDVVFVTVSIDPDKRTWMDGVRDGIHTSLSAVNLYTNGKGIEDPIIDFYQVDGYPRPLLFDRAGRIFSASSSELRNFNSLNHLILQARNKQ